MRAEHSRYVRKYFVWIDRRLAHITTRKAAALKFARHAGAADITFRERNVIRDLVRFGIMTRERAQAWAEAH